MLTTYIGIKRILYIPIVFFVACLSLYSVSRDEFFLDLAYWYCLLGCPICLLASIFIAYVNMSEWFWELVTSWLEGTLKRTPTGYGFVDGLTNIVVTSSSGPLYAGIVVVKGTNTRIEADLNPLDLTLFMELIGDS